MATVLVPMPKRFRIEGCTTSDSAALAYNNMTAFWTDPNWILMWHDTKCEKVIEQQERRMPANLIRDQIHLRHRKAVDIETGNVVGYARWRLPASGEVNLKDWQPDKVWPSACVPDVSPTQRQHAEAEYEATPLSRDNAMDMLEDRVQEMKEQLMKGKTYIVLELLAVQPAWRNKGVASLLVQSGLEEANRVGIDVFLHAYKAGLGVYQRAGFYVIDQIILDDSAFGGDGNYGNFFLVWKSSRGRLLNREPDLKVAHT